MSALLDEVRMGRKLPGPSACRRIRLAAGTTQQRIADELGVHWTTVARWERGAREPRGKLRADYSRLLAELAAEIGPPVSGDAA